MLGVKTTLAIDCAPIDRVSRSLIALPLGGHPERVPTGWNFPARHARACCGYPRLFLGSLVQSRPMAAKAAVTTAELPRVGKIACVISSHIARARFCPPHRGEPIRRNAGSASGAARTWRRWDMGARTP